MTDDLEELVKNASGFGDVRALNEKNPELKPAWLKSIEETINTLEDRINRCKLKDEEFKVSIW